MIVGNITICLPGIHKFTAKKLYHMHVLRKHEQMIKGEESVMKKMVNLCMAALLSCSMLAGCSSGKDNSGTGEKKDITIKRKQLRHSANMEAVISDIQIQMYLVWN